ncbi:MAG TPA: hypothetical protein VN408_05070 [Actinoplanes sp.]|nr:hypothetical protein [Actinoplanes sp.]
MVPAPRSTPLDHVLPTGAVRAWRDGAELPLGSPQQRTVLAVLLLREGLPTTIDELVDALGPGHPPAAAVRTCPSRPRRTLTTGGRRLPARTVRPLSWTLVNANKIPL